ncbi:MAG TPA: type II toxin-antitoxin system Phd/YefM family antitoxin [Dongiaceae bacterium]|jgi:prevent-host-death family protein|nr:type II toxin-antitoxin system Phd/YefM family antitoxin [Dongiaceae bacterium]
MRQFSATEAKQRMAELLDTVQREPVVIRRHERDIAVVISPEAYDRLRRANVAELQRLADRVGARAKRRGLTEKKLQQLLDDDR